MPKTKKKTYPAKSTKGKEIIKVGTEPTTPATPQEKPSETLGNTRRWARQIHGSQKDKAGRPYIEHLDAVAQGVYLLVGRDFELMQAAYLHDSIEDTGVDKTLLREQGYSDRVISTVSDVTKISNEPNWEYIGWVISGGVDSMLVKLSDLYHNTRADRLAKVTPLTTKDRLIKKYYPAIWRIERALIESGVDVKPTISYEEALKACKTAPYEPQWRESTSPSTVMKGDLMKFSEETKDEHALVVKSKTMHGSDWTFSYEDTKTKLSFKTGDRFWVKWSGGTSTKSPTAYATSYTPEWMKLMGLPKGWKEGDPIPNALDVPTYPATTYTTTKTPSTKTTKSASAAQPAKAKSEPQDNTVGSTVVSSIRGADGWVEYMSDSGQWVVYDAATDTEIPVDDLTVDELARVQAAEEVPTKSAKESAATFDELIEAVDRGDEVTAEDVQAAHKALFKDLEQGSKTTQGIDGQMVQGLDGEWRYTTRDGWPEDDPYAGWAH